MPTLPPMPAHGGKFDFSVTSSTLAGASEPNYVGSASSLYVPREQVEGAVSIHWSRRFTARADWLVGVSDGTVPLAGTAMRSPRGVLFGFGSGVTIRVGALDRPWFLELSADALLVSVPSFVRLCGAPCPVGTPGHKEGLGVFLFSAGAVGGIRVAPEVAIIFASAVRSQPTTEATFPSADSRSDVSLGSPNWLVGFGVELRLKPWLRVTPIVQFPVTASPVRYAPILTLGLSFSTVDEPQSAPELRAR